MTGIELEEGPHRPTAESVTRETLLRLQEGQIVGYVELIIMSAVKRAGTIGQAWLSVRDKVVRRSAGPNAGTTRK